MKKILSVIILSAFLVTGSPKPAQAIVIDPGQIAAKIAEIVQDISDAVQTGIQEVNKIKQMAAQGFNYQALIDKATEYATKYAVDYITHNILTKRFKEVEGDTNKQNKKVLEKDKENYKEATEALYDKQIEILKQEESATDIAQLEVLQKLNEAKSKEAAAKADYEAETNPEAKNQKLLIYMKYTSDVEKYNHEYIELNQKYFELLKQEEDLIKEKGKITSEDNQYKALEERVKAMEKDENKLITVDPGETEWDEVKIEDYDINKHYDEFMEQYFLDPTKLSDITAQQSHLDRIMRQRRYLVVNSAAHLMQVAATMRRSLPVQYKKNKDMFTSIGKDGGQLAAMEVYSASRVESARALAQYAKLLCAKLQYETARDLVKSEVQRKMQNNANFNLDNYILDNADINEMLAKFQYKDVDEEKSELNTDYYNNPEEVFENY